MDSKPTVFWERCTFASGETEYQISFDGPNRPHITLAVASKASWERLLIALNKGHEMVEYVEPEQEDRWDSLADDYEDIFGNFDDYDREYL